MKGASLRKAPALLANVKLGWKGLARINTLAYYEHPNIRATKGFLTLGPAFKVMKIFTPLLSHQQNKLECLSFLSLK
jgi:hypothetical protein